MKIFEFNPGIGTFSLGFEFFPENSVVQVQKIDKRSLSTYNFAHKNDFSAEKSQYIDINSLKKHDLGILMPDFGISMTRQYVKSLKMDDLWSTLAYIEQFSPKMVLILTPPAIIPHVNMASEYVTDGFDMVSKDIIIQSMQRSGYMCWQFVVDQVQCGVPMYYPVNFYVGVRDDLGDISDTQMPPIRYGIEDSKMPYTTVMDAIADLPIDPEEYDTYTSDPLNTYQAWCRQGKSKKLYNNKPQHPPNDLLTYLIKLKEGRSLAEISSKYRGRRAILNRPSQLRHDFHKIRGSGNTIHPVLHRVFTIREGMRLHGLPDHVRLPDNLAPGNQAKMVHESISPLTAYYVSQILDPYL